jgi:hypothetical protein
MRCRPESRAAASPLVVKGADVDIQTRCLFARAASLATAFILSLIGPSTAAFPAAPLQQVKPDVGITQPARWGPGGEWEMDLIAGRVSNAPADAMIVVYCYAAGMWWVQPFANRYSTPVKNGEWSTPTHLGQAYAALLTRKSWKAPPKLPELPRVGGEILAIREVGGRK